MDVVSGLGKADRIQLIYKADKMVGAPVREGMGLVKVECTRCRMAVSLRLEALGGDVRCKNCRATFLPLAQIPALDLGWDQVNFDLYMLCAEGLSAFGYHSEDEQFAVVRGSKFCRHPDEDLSRLYALLRDDLIESGVLLEDSDGQHYTLTETYCFDDFHTAASLIFGHDEDGDLVWTLVEDEVEDEDENEVEDEDEDEDAVEEEVEDEDEDEDEDCQYNEGTHFLDLSREHIRELIVEVLEQRPNNSVKRDELVAEILRHIGIRTSGGPRLQFTSQVMLEVQWLGRQRVLKRYKVKNNRVRLTTFYRSRLAMTPQPEDAPTERRVVSGIDRETSATETIDSLRAEIVRLKKVVAVLLDGQGSE